VNATRSWPEPATARCGSRTGQLAREPRTVAETIRVALGNANFPTFPTDDVLFR